MRPWWHSLSVLYFKVNRQYLLTCKVSRYCPLALNGNILCPCIPYIGLFRSYSQHRVPMIPEYLGSIFMMMDPIHMYSVVLMAGDRHQKPTSIDVRCWRLKSVGFVGYFIGYWWKIILSSTTFYSIIHSITFIRIHVYGSAKPKGSNCLLYGSAVAHWFSNKFTQKACRIISFWITAYTYEHVRFWIKLEAMLDP